MFQPPLPNLSLGFVSLFLMAVLKRRFNVPYNTSLFQSFLKYLFFSFGIPISYEYLKFYVQGPTLSHHTLDAFLALGVIFAFSIGRLRDYHAGNIPIQKVEEGDRSKHYYSFDFLGNEYVNMQTEPEQRLSRQSAGRKTSKDSRVTLEKIGDDRKKPEVLKRERVVIPGEGAKRESKVDSEFLNESLLKMLFGGKKKPSLEVKLQQQRTANIIESLSVNTSKTLLGWSALLFSMFVVGSLENIPGTRPLVDLESVANRLPHGQVLYGFIQASLIIRSLACIREEWAIVHEELVMEPMFEEYGNNSTSKKPK